MGEKKQEREMVPFTWLSVDHFIQELHLHLQIPCSLVIAKSPKSLNSCKCVNVKMKATNGYLEELVFILGPYEDMDFFPLIC